jgi:hypothetical protein
MNCGIAVIFLSIGTLAALLFLKFRQLRAKKSPVQSAQTPSSLMSAVKNLKLARAQISSATSREFSQLLSNALKMYIRRRYKLPSLISTTDEITNRLLADASNDWSLISLLAEVLKLADSAKYSQRKLSIPQQRGAYKKACMFVLLSERHFRAKKCKVQSNKFDVQNKKM